MSPYKIKEFSKRSGITPDTLRYYEKIGVISSIRQEENAYRTFTDYDLMEALQVRFLRSVNTPLTDLRPNQNPHRLSHIFGQMDREAEELEAEIKTLNNRLLRVNMLKNELEECQTKLNVCTQVEYPKMAAIYLPPVMDDESAAIVSSWTECMPYTHISFRIPEEQVRLRENAVMNAQIGFGMLYSYAEKLGVPVHSPVEVTQPHRGVRCILRIQNPIHPKTEDFKPFITFLSENSLHPTGPWHYRLRFIDTDKNGKRHYYIAMRVGIV